MLGCGSPMAYMVRFDLTAEVDRSHSLTLRFESISGKEDFWTFPPNFSDVFCEGCQVTKSRIFWDAI